MASSATANFRFAPVVAVVAADDDDVVVVAAAVVVVVVVIVLDPYILAILKDAVVS